jgi:hypothetical protein
VENNLSNEASPSSTDLTNKDNPQAIKISPPAQAAPRNGPSWLVVIVMVIVISATVSATTTWVYDAKYAQKVVAVDIKGYVARQGEDFMAGKLTEEQFRQKFDHLQKVVEAIPPNKVVLMGDLVVRNVETIKP